MVSEIVKYLLFWYLVVIMLRICYNYNCIYAKILKKGNYAYEKETTCTMDFYWIGIRYCGRHVVDGPAGHCGNLHQALWHPVSEPAEIHRSSHCLVLHHERCYFHDGY